MNASTFLIKCTLIEKDDERSFETTLLKYNKNDFFISIFSAGLQHINKFTSSEFFLKYTNIKGDIKTTYDGKLQKI